MIAYDELIDRDTSFDVSAHSLSNVLDEARKLSGKRGHLVQIIKDSEGVYYAKLFSGQFPDVPASMNFVSVSRL